MGHNKEISIKRPLDIGQEAKLPEAKAAKNNFYDNIKKSDNSVLNNSKKILTGTILDKEIEKYKQACKEDKEKEYIASYLLDKNILKGNTKTSEEFYSLLLIRLIENGDRETVRHILSLPHSDNILVKKCDWSVSPISVLLGSNNEGIFEEVVEYLNANYKTIEKAELKIGDSHYEDIKFALKFPSFGNKTTLELSYPLARLYDLHDHRDLVSLIDNKEILELFCGNEDLSNG